MITPKVSDIVGIINKVAPFAEAESWDNVGLQIGSPGAPVDQIMVALDPCREAVNAALTSRCQLLVTHHPLIFNPLKKITSSDATGSIITTMIKNDIALVAMHTNYDIAVGGMNDLLAERLGIESTAPLQESGKELLLKLVVFVPAGHESELLAALAPFCSSIGNYSDCSFRVAGTGTYRPLQGAQPYIGEIGKREEVGESRLEVMLRKAELASALNALRKAHPYEEPAFDLYQLMNKADSRGGLGRIGKLPAGRTLGKFAAEVGELLGVKGIRIVGDPARQVNKVALCGGSGATLLREALFQGADVLVTGDIKYHEAREAEAAGLAIVDAGHFATELPMVAGFARVLRQELERRGLTAEVNICQDEKDPFIFLPY